MTVDTLQVLRALSQKQTELRGGADLIGRHVKLSEETGELAQELLGVIGHPNASRSASGDPDGLKEEAVDVVICALDIFFAAGGDLHQLEALMDRKLSKWSGKLNKEPKYAPTFE